MWHTRGMGDLGIEQLLTTVKQLPHSLPLTDLYHRPHGKRPTVWYEHQKEHLTGWLSEYQGAGAYGRSGTRDSSEFFYNHFQCWQGLLWLVEALGEDLETLQRAADAVLQSGKHSASQCAAFRRVIPWSRVVILLRDYKKPRKSVLSWFRGK